MRPQFSAVCASVLLGLSLLTVPAASAAAATGNGTAVANVPCFNSDGYALSGNERGKNPVKYEYGNSPYVGARYTTCTDVIKVYYGGYTGLTHYNVRWLAGQQELRATGAEMVWTVTPPLTGDSYYSFSVQGCKRPVIGSSTCTRWSPVVLVRVVRK